MDVGMAAIFQNPHGARSDLEVYQNDLRLAELAEGAERTAHVAAAREAWTSIERPDLVALLDRFG